MAKKAATKVKPPVPKADSRTVKALRAKLALAEGKTLTQTQRRDLQWYDKTEADRITQAWAASVPKGIYCDFAGRQQRTIDEQADRYDLPIDGAVIDLWAAIRAYHDLITANARYIRPADDAQAIEDGEVDLADAQHNDLQTEKLRQEVIKLKQSNERLGIQVTRDRGDSIDRRELRDMLTWLSTRLEGFGQQLRRCADGTEAQKTLNEFLEHLADEVTQGVLRI